MSAGATKSLIILIVYQEVLKIELLNAWSPEGDGNAILERVEVELRIMLLNAWSPEGDGNGSVGTI